MKSLLGKVGFPKAIGVYVGDGEVTVSQVVSTPFGPVEIARRSENADPDELVSVIRRLIEPILGRDRFHRISVAVGISAERTYFATRPIQNPGNEASPHVLLREALRSPNILVGEMAVDVIKAQPDKRPVASIVACDSQYLTGILEALQECGVRPLRAEPAPCALLRAGASRRRSRHSAKVVVRLFLDESRALGILVADKLPVVWRLAGLRRGDEASSILSAIRSLAAVSKDCGIQSPLDAVVVHGRPDLPRLLDTGWLEKQVGVPVDWVPDPPLASSQVAFGLAIGCLNRDQRAFDLSHSLKPQASLWELFPLREAALQVGLILCMAVLLAGHYLTLSDSYAAIQAESSKHHWMESMQEPQLVKERDELNQKVAAVRKFLDTRITWTSYQRDLAACLPDNVFLTSLQGVSELEQGGNKASKGKPKKSLVIRASVVISKDGLVPQEVDRFLNTLRNHPALKRDFPVVELTDLKQLEGTDDGPAIATFTVVCLPKSAKGGTT